MPHEPAAFFSYVHFDDETDGGRLTEFRKRLSAEVRVQTGEEFPIFQDKDLKWGENWKKRIDESLDSTTFFIPVITPSFFNSQPCLDELERFLEREKKLVSGELVLPVYYVDTPLINEKPEGSTRKEKLAQVIASRQYFDWRELRFEALTSALISKTIAQLARQIRDAIQRTQAPSKSEELAGKKRGESIAAANNNPLTSGSGTASVAPAREQISSSAETLAKVVSKTEPPTRVVDLMHRADYTTITAAVQAANPGDRILVRAGLYNEGIVIDKPLEIIGDAPAGEAVIRVTGKHVLIFKTSMGRIANLVLRQAGGGKWYGIDIAQGRLEVEDCDITSDSLACVAVHGGADPRLRRNRIHDGKQSGVYVKENGQGIFEDNDIFSNALAGVEVKTGGNPTLRRNRIHNGKQSGVYVQENGQGIFEDNDIFSNTLAGVLVKTGGNPTLRRNRIHDGKAGGVFVYETGQGIFEDNDIFSNALAGVEVKTGGNPTLRRNRIYDGKQSGVYVQENGQGIFEDNDIFSNALAGVEVKTGGNPTLRRNRIHDGKQSGVYVQENGQGIFEDNDIFSNTLAGVLVKIGGNPTLRRNRIHDGKQSGVHVYETGQGTFEDNDIFSNALAGVEVKTGGNPTLRRNRIHDGKQSGVYVQENGQGIFEDNDIFSNTLAGVSVKTGGNPTLRCNRINKNAQVGVRVYEQGTGIFEENDLRENIKGAWDISEDSKANVKLAKNIQK